jgi:hypothetical protein
MTSRRSEWFDEQSTCQRSLCGRAELRDPQQVVGGCYQEGGQAGALDSSIARTPKVADRFDRAEDFLHPLAHPLAERVARPAGGARVQCRAARCAPCTAPSAGRLSTIAPAGSRADPPQLHLLEQRRELWECDLGQRLDQSDRMVGRHSLLRIYPRQHRGLWPIVSPQLPLPPQPHWPRSTIPTPNHSSIPSARPFSTSH